MKSLDPEDQAILDRAKAAIADVIAFSRRTGTYTEAIYRAEISSRGEWLLGSINDLEKELQKRD
jgi:hypothetical protein